MNIRPQSGFQERTLSCPADILINGGGAGPGKTFALLLEAIRHHKNPRFGATIFRRTSPEITKQGGLWDESYQLYPHLSAKPNQQTLKWVFPSGASVQFDHMQHEKDKYKYDGSQIALIGFDQLEHFSEGQFWYMWARNRSTCGVRPYIRATCNPIPADDETGGWLHRLIAWWIGEDGHIIGARDGIIRYFVRQDEQIFWGDSREELQAKFPHVSLGEILSFTFIEGRLEENVILNTVDPSYKAKLLALPKYERERLLNRNWNARPTAGNVFNRSWFEIVDAVPSDCIWVRYWDKAGTEDGGCNSAGVKMGYHEKTRTFYVGDCVVGQWSAGRREAVIKQTAQLDGPNVEVYVEQEPGSGGKESAENTIKNLPGYVVHADAVHGDKFKRAGPMSAQSEASNVKILAGEWNKEYLDELHNFSPQSRLKDRVDASTGGFNKLALRFFDVDMLGGGATKPVQPVQLNEQEVDPSIIEGIRQGGIYWPA